MATPDSEAEQGGGMRHNITFEPATHRYFCDGKELESVSKLAKSVVPPFDRDTIAARCAHRDRKPVDEILAEWEAKAEAARERGTLTHTYCEDLLDGRHDPVLAAMNTRLPEFDAADAAWAAFRERLDARVVWKERIVGDPSLGVAGRADLMLDVVVDGEVQRCLLDWKTGTMETHGRFGNLLPPFDFLTDCEHAKYSIQLSTYRLLLEREDPTAVFSDSYLVHLRPNKSFRIHRVLDVREQVLTWLQERQRSIAA